MRRVGRKTATPTTATPAAASGQLSPAPRIMPRAPAAAAAANPPVSQRSILCDTRQNANHPVLNGLSTPGAWNTARQLRLTMRTRRRYSRPGVPAVSS